MGTTEWMCGEVCVLYKTANYYMIVLVRPNPFVLNFSLARMDLAGWTHFLF